MFSTTCRQPARAAISLVEVDGSVVLRVDGGGGIPSGQRLRVFARFVRLDEARARDDGGAGLGLAIVAEAARTHGGMATAATSPGRAEPGFCGVSAAARCRSGATSGIGTRC